MAFVAVAAALFAVIAWFIESRPPTWEPYSAANLQKRLAEGRPVLVFVNAGWSVHPGAAVFSRRVCRRLRRQGVVAMRADWTASTPAVDALMQQLGTQRAPALAIFPGEPGAVPRTTPWNASDEQILAALQSVAKSTPPPTPGRP